MVKLIVPLIIGLLAGISGGGFYAVKAASAKHATAIADAKKHGIKPANDSSHAEAGADSSATEGSEHTATEPVAAAAEGHDTTATVAAAEKPAADDVHAPAAEHAPAAHATPTATKPPTPTSVVAASAAANEAETQAHQRRLAKIFATMSAKDASRVLTQMTDHDVGIILGLLSDRQAAAILTNLPATRAAALSQLQPRRVGGGT
jgi:cytoskeletal protein RodZ